MRLPVLVLTNSEDDSTGHILRELEALACPYIRFNTECFPFEAFLTMYVNDEIEKGFLRTTDSSPIALAAIKSVWYRRPAPAWIPDTMPAGYVQFIQREAGTALWSLYTCMGGFWMNPPLWSSKLLESNKLYQLKEAKRMGLRVPDTVVGNEPSAFYELAERHGGVIAAKSLRAGMFVKEDDAQPLFLFTQLINLETLRASEPGIRLCPLMGQEYIAKKIELRITVVGCDIFACAIHSQDSLLTKVDWRRYDFAHVRHEVWKLPSEIEVKLLTLLRQLNLVYGAIDMILTPDGEYVFLEINANGQWVWIEELCGMPISTHMARLLANPPTSA